MPDSVVFGSILWILWIKSRYCGPTSWEPVKADSKRWQRPRLLVHQFVTAWLSVRCLAGREADTEVFPGRDFRGHILQYRNQWKPCLLSAFLVLSNLHYVSRLLSFLHLNSSCNNSFPVSASLLGLLVTLLWVP